MSSGKGKKKDVQLSGIKRRRLIDDDDFVDDAVVGEPSRSDQDVGPSEKDTKKAKGDSRFPTLSHRTTPRTIVDSLALMNANQRTAVYGMGFGSLFLLTIRELPCRLAHWIVNNYKPRSSTLTLPGKRTLHITEQDVWLTLGFPMGANEIIRNPSFSRNELVDEWAADIGKPKADILPIDVVNAMMADRLGGVRFRKNFLILLEFCLIESPSEGHVRPKIMDVLEDIANVDKYNWCKYVLSTLMHCHEKWTSSNRGKFSASVLFLMIFYVDRVEILGRSVKRSFPAFDGWTSPELMKRQSDEMRYGSFGDGYIAKRFVPSDSRVAEVCFGLQPPIGPSPGSMSELDAEAYTNELIRSASHVTTEMRNVLNIISAAPQHVIDSNCFKIALDACRHMFRLPVADPICNPSEPSSTLGDGPRATQALAAASPDWNKPEWDVWLNEVYDAWNMQNNNILLSQNGPSCGTGLTQKCGNDVNIDDSEPFVGSDPPPVNLNADDNVCHRTPSGDGLAGTSNPGGGASPCPGVDSDERGTEDLLAAMNEAYDELESNNELSEPVGFVAVGARSSSGDVGKATMAREDPTAPTVSKKRDHPRPRNEGGAAASTEADTGDLPAQPRTVSTRSAASRRVPAALSSPYMTREVSAALKLTKDEKIYYYWLLTGQDSDLVSFLYDYNERRVTRDNFMTMLPNELISCEIINAWASFLNYRENMKAPDTLSRFYFTTYPLLKTVVDPHVQWSKSDISFNFCDRIDDELVRHDGESLNTIDLVFFPVFQDDHYYVICFNFRAKNVVIIDNSDVVDDEPLSTKYKIVPQDLFKLFMFYLTSRGMGQKTKKMSAKSIERMRMSWRNSSNKVDCGVYAMRHMEVYKGEKVDCWTIGLSKDKDPTRNLRFLRAKYSTALLTAGCNAEKEKNKTAAHVHFNNAVRGGLQVDVPSMILNY